MDASLHSGLWSVDLIDTFNTRTCADSDHVSETNSTDRLSFARPSIRQPFGSRPTQRVSSFGWTDHASTEPLEQLSSHHHESPHRRNSSGLPFLQEWPERAATAGQHFKSARQRPQMGVGLPTSYNHNRNHSLSSSSSASSHSPHSLPQALSSASLSSPTFSPRVVERKSSLPVLFPSPSLHLSGLVEWPRPGSLCHSKAEKQPFHSTSTKNSLGQTSSLRQAPYSSQSKIRGCSRSFSVSEPFASAPDYRRPSAPALMIGDSSVSHAAAGPSIQNPPKQSSRRRRDAPASKRTPDHSRGRLSMSHSHPDLLSIVTPDGERQICLTTGKRTTRHQPTERSRAPLIVTELDYSPHYLEPYNSCEAIMLPRPRLRSRSMGATPSIVVERVHAVPERFWQTSDATDDPTGPTLVPRSKVIRQKLSLGDALRTRSETHLGTAHPVKKDFRLSLHENIPPPLPPKDSPVPSSQWLPWKSLPPTPAPQTTPGPATPRPATPEPTASRESSESLEQLEAPDLLQRNRELDQDRQAWRQEHRSSLGANISPMRGSLSPCVRSLSPAASPLAKQRSETAIRFDNASPIKVHRVRNGDGTDPTLLVVQAQSNRPYSKCVASASSPELRRATGASKQRGSLIRHWTRRLGSWTSKLCERGTVKPRIQRPLPSNDDQAKSAKSTADASRLIGRGRRLVTDETVIIGRQPRPDQDAPTRRESPIREEVRLGVALPGPASPSKYHASPSRYRPAGTRDEIKAQLGEHLPWQARSPFLLDVNGDFDASGAGASWIDQDSDTFARNILDTLRSRRHSQEGEVDFPQLFDPPALSSPSSALTSRSDSAPSTRHDTEAALEPTGLMPPIATRPEDSDFAASGDTRDSSISTREVALWDASSVDFDNLFFRPPQR